jgi:RNA polymerase sigma-70 factor (ECF subfamily)
MMSDAPDGAAPRSSTDDAALIARLARGDRAALAELYDRYAPPLLAVARRMLGSGREAEDLLHDVFLEAWRSAHDYDPVRGSVRAWLVMRCRSRALDRMRATSRAKVVLSERGEMPERLEPAPDLTLRRDQEKALAALAALAPEQRQVLELAYFSGLSAAEIAEALDIPIGTVKSRTARGLAQLRQGLNDAQATAKEHADADR